MTDKPHGTGLGLPISRQIIEHFGGRLWVESVPGEGATFVFELPVAKPAAGAAPIVRNGARSGHASFPRRRSDAWARRY